MHKYHAPLLADNYYHIFNRAIGNEKLFLSPEDYYNFLEGIKRHVLPVADIFAYSLLPNHFHLLARIKSQDSLEKYFNRKKRKAFNVEKHDMPDFVMERFSNWLNSYAKVFNEKYVRKGALFIDYTKRIEGTSDADILSFLLYIHQNAVHHGLEKEIGRWPFDSYKAILGYDPTLLMRSEIIRWFGPKERFVEFHKQPVRLRTQKIISDLIG